MQVGKQKAWKSLPVLHTTSLLYSTLLCILALVYYTFNFTTTMNID